MLTSTDLPRTAARSPHLLVLPRAGSTNADLVAAVASVGGLPHLSVVVTDDQTAGRGRLDRSWVAAPGAALALSVLLRVPRIPTSARGWIPLMVGAAMTRAVRSALAGTADSAVLKWPNDVLVDGRKICGILCETVPGATDAVIAGTGVNTAMTAEQLPVPTATSFAVLGVPLDADRLIADYLTILEEHIDALSAVGDAGAAGIRAEVEALCDTLGRDVAVHLPGGAVLRGRAQRIDEDGCLVVDTGVREERVAAGDVVHVR